MAALDPRVLEQNISVYLSAAMGPYLTNKPLYFLAFWMLKVHFTLIVLSVDLHAFPVKTANVYV